MNNCNFCIEKGTKIFFNGKLGTVDENIILNVGGEDLSEIFREKLGVGINEGGIININTQVGSIKIEVENLITVH